MNRLIHFHGASIGEASCLLVVISDLIKNHDLTDYRILLTYTSESAAAWLSRRKIPSKIIVKKYKGRTELGRYLREGEYDDHYLIVAEKDRRSGLLACYGKDRVFNIEAKPPQSTLSDLYERLIAKSIRRIRWFSVENEKYRLAIEEYNPNAKIDIVGTLKAVRKGGPPKKLTNHYRIVFISALEQELPVIRQIINRLKKAPIPIMSVIIPRYVNISRYPPKNWKRFKKRAEKLFPGARYSADMRSLEKSLQNSAGIQIYQSVGDVEGVLESMNLAVVCGSLADSTLLKAKGHNFFEPLAQSIPTIIGPKYSNWEFTVERLEQQGVLLVATKATDIGDTIVDLLRDPFRYQELSEKIFNNEYLVDLRNSNEKTRSVIADWLGLEESQLKS